MTLRALERLNAEVEKIVQSEGVVKKEVDEEAKPLKIQEEEEEEEFG